jgi:hypothetical protein
LVLRFRPRLLRRWRGWGTVACSSSASWGMFLVSYILHHTHRAAVGPKNMYNILLVFVLPTTPPTRLDSGAVSRWQVGVISQAEFNLFSFRQLYDIKSQISFRPQIPITLRTVQTSL